MSDISELTPPFLRAQEASLRQMREELSRNSNASAQEERELQDNSLHRSEGSGDEAQKISLRDNDVARFEHTAQRIRMIDRALQKMAERSYGLSDLSGEPIAMARLKAMPESLLTVAESAAAEAAEPQ